jgi:hypothetical protein
MKVKVTFTLAQAMKAQTGSRGIALLIFNLGVTEGWEFNATYRRLCPQERDPVPIVQEALWAPVRKTTPPPGFEMKDKNEEKMVHWKCEIIWYCR